MATTLRTVLLVAAACSGARSLDLPPYIKACSRNDPNFNACAKKSAAAAIPQFIHGDPKYRVPELDPLLVEELTVEQPQTASIGLSFSARNASIYGLRNTIVDDVRIDLQKQHITYDLTLAAAEDPVHVQNVSGRILILPIFGSGPGDLLLRNVTGRIDYDFDRQRRGADDYVIPKNSRLTFDAKHMSIKLKNLFNGDKFLGENMNQVLNDNWREFLKEISPAVAEAFNQVVVRLLTNIFVLVPYDVAFRDN